MANLDEIQIKISQDSKNASKAIDELIDSLEELSKASDLGKTAENINGLSGSIDSLSNASKKLGGIDFGGKIKGFGTSVLGTLKSLAGWGVSLTVIGKQLADSTKLASKYTQTVNMLNTVMGEGAEEAKEFAKELGDVLGLNPADTMNFQATFQNLFVGFGNNSKQAQIMSKNLTQLSYDMAAFYEQLGGNPEAAAEKLRLAMAGTIEPIQRLGYAIKEADLQAVAARQGLNVNIRNLNTASKSMLRYIAIMEQSGHVQGYMAKSFDSPTTAMMVFQSAVKQLSTEIGKTFLPMLMAAIPYIHAFITGVLNMVKTINSILGIELPTIEGWDETKQGISGIGDEAEQAGKKIQKAFTLGIDELNVLDSSASDATAGMQDITGQLKLSEYNMLDGFDSEKIKEIEETLKPLEPLFEGLATAFAGFYDSVSWLAGDVFYPWLVDVGNWMKENPDTMRLLGEGLALIGAGLLIIKGVGAIAKILDLTGLIGLLGLVRRAFEECLIPMTIDGEVISTWSRLGDKVLVLLGYGLLLYGAYLAVKGAIGLVTGTGSDVENLTRLFSGLIIIVTSLFVVLGLVSGWPAVALVAFAGLVVFIMNSFDKIVYNISILGLAGLNLLDHMLISVAEWFTNVLRMLWAMIGDLFVGLGVKLPAALGAITPKIQKWFLGLIKSLVDKLSSTELGGKIVEMFKLDKGIDAAIAGVEKTLNAYDTAWNWGTDVQNNNAKWVEDKKKENADYWDEKRYYFDMDTVTRMNEAEKNYNAAMARKEEDKKEWESTSLLNEISKLVSGIKEDTEESKVKEESDDEDVIATITKDVSDVVSALKTEIPNMTSDITTEISKMTSSLQIEEETNAESLEGKIGDLDVSTQNQYDIIKENGEVAAKLGEEQSSYLNLLNNSTLSNTSTIGDKISLFRDDTIEALSEVEDACRNIDIEIHKHYGGDGYASGGFPTSGEMFFAREDGLPEMVGRVGRQTAVMNNGQIADTMAQSLIRAMSQGGTSQSPTVIENKLYLDGEVVYNNQQRIQRSKGYNLGMGVFANA